MGKSEKFTTQAMLEQLQKQVSVSALVEKAEKTSLPGFLNQMMGKKGITTDALAELSALNRASLYKILNGSTKKPQRNVLLRLALTLQLSFQETQQLLKAGGRAHLSSSRGRDIIISDGIVNQRGIDDVCRSLRKYDYQDLYVND